MTIRYFIWQSEDDDTNKGFVIAKSKVMSTKKSDEESSKEVKEEEVK